MNLYANYINKFMFTNNEVKIKQIRDDMYNGKKSIVGPLNKNLYEDI